MNGEIEQVTLVPLDYIFLGFVCLMGLGIFVELVIIAWAMRRPKTEKEES